MTYRLIHASLSSPALMELRTFQAASDNTVEIHKTQLGQQPVKETEMPMQDAINYRAKLIQQGWIEMTAPTLQQL